MTGFGIGIILIVLLLAILSRKNFSKYKETGKRSITWIFYGIAAWMVQQGRMQWLRRKLKAFLRKLHPWQKELLEKETEAYMVRMLAVVPAGLLLTGSLFLLLGCFGTKTSNELERGAYGESEKIYQVEITQGTESDIYQLEVAPREYDSLEFQNMAEAAYDYLNQRLLGDNTDLEQVTEDLQFDAWDESRTIRVKWQTDFPSIINSSGRVNREGLEQDTEVTITASLSSGEYEQEFQWAARVAAENVVLEGTEKVADTLQKLEQESRTDESFLVPEQIGDAKVHLVEKSTAGMICKILLLTLICMGCLIYRKLNKLKEDGKKRDAYFSDQYFRLINKLVLMLGAGMTIRLALQRFTVESIQEGYAFGELLKAEIRICLNELEAGATEQRAYAALGNRIGLPEYMRLFSLIGQNASHGNSNLLELLEAEEKDAIRSKKERARKKGEEASGKLLIPMFVLMLMVIGIVIFPALKSF